MSARIFAVVVVHNGASQLADTLTGLRQQTVQVPVIVVDTASTDDSAAVARAGGVNYIVRTGADTSFGAAVGDAVDAVIPDLQDDDWLWLLHDDSTPEPTALAHLLSEHDRSPSALLLGPKLIDADRPDHLDEFGLTMTTRGEKVSPAAGELDQAQFDTQSDVLAVGTAGMLIQGGLWRRLGGLDTNLAFSDDGLDLGIRARLAGARVVTVPSARVAHHRLSERSSTPAARTRRPKYRQVRWAQLYRRLSYTTGTSAVFLWLALPFIAFGRTLQHLFDKRPGLIAGEWAATVTAMFSRGRVAAHRRRIADASVAPWSAIEPLLLSAGSVNRLRADQREEALFIDTDVDDDDTVPFWRSKAPLVALALWAFNVLLLWRLIAAGEVSGGAVEPLRPDWWASFTSLFSLQHFGAVDTGLMTDPNSALWTLLSALTFWHPSTVIVLLLLTAMPLAFASGWYLMRALSKTSWVRIVGAVVWALSPVFVQALVSGDLSPTVFHIVLPLAVGSLLAVARPGNGRERSIGRAAAAGLWLALLSACSPIGWIVLLAGILVWSVFAHRLLRSLWAVLIPSLVVWVGPVRDAVVTHDWLGLLSIGGSLPSSGPNDPLDLLLPGSAPWLWQTLVPALDGQPLVAQAVAAISAAVLIVIGLVGLFTHRWGRVLIGLVLFSATGALAVVLSGITSIRVFGAPSTWDTTPLLSAATLFLLVAISGTLVGARVGLAKTAAAVAVCGVAVGIAAPGALAISQGGAVGAVANTAPALVQAEERNAPGGRVLEIVANPDGSFDATTTPSAFFGTLQGRHRQVISARSLDDGRQQVESTVSNLASYSGYDPTDALNQMGARFVLLRAADSTVSTDRVSSVLDANTALEPAGRSDIGQLWRVTGSTAVTDSGPSIWWLIVPQAIVLLFFLALSLPTGRLRDEAETSSALSLLEGDADDV
ncbi:glycosyltransferase family 2 protein [Pseudoclavibacter sp. CFCC 11306]|uniref:glycosyltransferase family 2 protein n=1 Tax=Pseudoclavibacter sp. CFCC 11306 TaxID=1564493 RepID=UPI00130144A8|nr:glycosyltransferase family 2 protein [Pseudoclavibacter sp. CFCC 11306]KAB1657029.1 glycosyltransferase [Pseudoclavibacter sp. CFCC 11306]